MDELKSLLLAEAPPAHDPVFTLGVMRAIERRRFRRELLMSAGLAAVAALVLAPLAPVLNAALHQSVMPVLGNGALLALLAAVTLVLPQMFPARND